MQSSEPAAVNLPLPEPGQRPALCVMVLGTSRPWPQAARPMCA